jgi:hypothetical protein
MPAYRTSELAVAIGGIAVVVALAAAAAIVAPPAAQRLPAGSSLSYQADGSAAAYLTLERAGYDVRRSFDAVSALTVDPAETVLILADPVDVPTNSDRRSLQALAASGATVLLTGCGATAFLSTDRSFSGDSTAAPRPFTRAFPSPLSADAPRITMAPDCGWWNPGEHFTVLYGDDHSAAVRFAKTGSGMLVWWSGSTPLTNASIDEPGQLELLLDLVGVRGRTILWDEFYHGQRRSLVSYALHTPLPWVSAQILLTGLVAAAIYVRRRAPIVERVAESRASPLEFVDTLAGLYGRASTAGDAVATARIRLRRLLAEATGLSASADDRRLAEAAGARLRIDATETASALEAAAALTDDTTLPGEALAAVRRLQTAAAALRRMGG